jgi:hypothetical protein
MTEPENARERERENCAPEMPDDFARLLREIQSAPSMNEGAAIFDAHEFSHYSRLQLEHAFQRIGDALNELPE